LQLFGEWVVTVEPAAVMLKVPASDVVCVPVVQVSTSLAVEFHDPAKDAAGAVASQAANIVTRIAIRIFVLLSLPKVEIGDNRSIEADE
jgi:hypothetical protein